MRVETSAEISSMFLLRAGRDGEAVLVVRRDSLPTLRVIELAETLQPADARLHCRPADVADCG